MEESGRNAQAEDPIVKVCNDFANLGRRNIANHLLLLLAFVAVIISACCAWRYGHQENVEAAVRMISAGIVGLISLALVLEFLRTKRTIRKEARAIADKARSILYLEYVQSNAPIHKQEVAISATVRDSVKVPLPGITWKDVCNMREGFNLIGRVLDLY